MNFRLLRRQVALLGSFLLWSCAQSPQPGQPEVLPSGAHSQPFAPSKVVSVPSSEIAPAPATDPAVYFDQAAYAMAIRSKVRKNLVLPRNVPDSASATVEVVLSDTGTVAGLKTLNSSGFPAYDAAIRRAIQRGQPYPLLDVPDRQGPLTMRLRFQMKD